MTTTKQTVIRAVEHAHAAGSLLRAAKLATEETRADKATEATSELQAALAALEED